MKDSHKFVVGVGALCLVSAGAGAQNCDRPLAAAAVYGQFERLALEQLRLEFGAQKDMAVQAERAEPVGVDLFRVDAWAQYRKPGSAAATRSFISGWVSRCTGTVIVRDHTWLADGTLAAPRYTRDQLPGRGITLGRADAPLRVVAYVDSRCSQCHRLIAYARELVKQGKLYIELRQVAYLETAQQAVKDTRLGESGLVVAGKAWDIEAYVDMLAEFNNEAAIDEAAPGYKKALELVETNTRSAREILHITTVPGVLVFEANTAQYRIAGFWEMNRMFQSLDN